ncbi:GNAT family N-acetyltransferase [Sphingomonas mollis]|uniref:GNAT family N-acetyltransferase n=1 Tax=Sphingomonas mollis TaxID=2795726 RepID=A0ABS0XSS5_9SPHN|nr:GNAT family N-acetyltransferase [Sphingomonas sp. BT553]MBJ6123082.1 GNAT family N-acetyltransferase [Sphingomonas sp. BT553]
MTLAIRRVEPGDVVAILDLIVALAVYEREPDAVRATEASLHATLFGPAAEVFAHVAEIDGRVEGVALWFRTYSTWTGRPSLYLEDLFVSEAARGTGAGKALLTALAQEAKRQDCARIDWAVLDWNDTAKTFYSHIGAKRSAGWEPWRLEGEALDRLAGEG